MGFKSVYQCLTDVFPQVDSRILKAVAIENSKNAEAAVEIVLSEVLPYLSKRSMVSDMVSNVTAEDSYPNALSDGDAEPENQSTALRRRMVRVGKTVGTSSEPISIGNENSNKIDLTSGVHFANSTCEENTLDSHAALSWDSVVDTNELKGSVEGDEVTLSEKRLNLSNDSQSEIIQTSEIMEMSMMYEQNVDNNQVCAVVETEVAASLCNSQDINITTGHEQAPQDISTSLIEENGGSTSGDFKNLICGINPQEEFCLDGAKLEVENSVVEQTTDAAEGDLHSEFSTSSNNNCENVESKQENKLDLLEEIIEAAKFNKKTLFMAMESVMNMMREVELQEKAAEQAKEEAARGGLDILVKVEELKQMLAHAKEENDMHTGEVYGEKAILATEVRELQTRLLSISDERDKSLSILDEMHQVLEGRMAAALELRKAAEQEKLEKEESARKALAEQEAIMEKVVQEAKILQQEAEENSKLREFLLDRGRVVDTLQGEISVICQDVRLLKEKFDERVPLSQSISSSQTSCILASSASSSLKSIASDHQLDVTSKSPSKKSPTSSLDGLSPKSMVDGKEILDDGWDFVE